MTYTAFCQQNLSSAFCWRRVWHTRRPFGSYFPLVSSASHRFSPQRSCEQLIITVHLATSSRRYADYSTSSMAFHHLTHWQHASSLSLDALSALFCNPTVASGVVLHQPPLQPHDTLVSSVIWHNLFRQGHCAFAAALLLIRTHTAHFPSIPKSWQQLFR